MSGTGTAGELQIPEPGRQRIRFVDEQLALVRRTRLERGPEPATEQVVAALRAGLWSHSRLWSELLSLPDGPVDYPLIRTLWLESPRRCHADIPILRVVAYAAAAAGNHDAARALLRKAILREGYRRRRLRVRLRRRVRSAAARLRPGATGRYRDTLADLGRVLGEAGGRPFLVGETLRRHAAGAPMIGDGRGLELGVLDSDLARDTLERAVRESPAFEVARPFPGAGPLRLRHVSQVTIDLSPHGTAEGGRIWRDGTAVRWWYAGFGLASTELLGVGGFVPDPPERYLAESYPDWQAVPDGFDPRLDAPNAEITDPELFGTLHYATLLEAMIAGRRPAYRRYLQLLGERNETEPGDAAWLPRLRLRTI